MKLRNKKTGEIGIVESEEIPAHRFIIRSEKTGECYVHSSLAELNEEWEDYEEPKEWWYLDVDGEVCSLSDEDDMTKDMKQIGNYFETKEEAEKAVEKLRAYKRLKDSGFNFVRYKRIGFGGGPFHIDITASIDGNSDTMDEYEDDLNLLFGGEE